MDFWKAILGLARRKFIIVPLLGLAIAVGLAGYFLTPLRYVSSTTMVLVTPAFGGTLSQDPTAPTGLKNPMLSFGSDLQTAAAILIYTMNTSEAMAQLGAVRGGPTKLTIDDGRTSPHMLDNRGPFVYIAAESTSRAEATDIVVRAQKRMRQELIDRQASLDAPPQTYLAMVDVVPPTTPEVKRADRIKVGGIALVLSLVFGLAIAYAWECLRASRHRLADDELDVAQAELSADERAESADTGFRDGDHSVEQDKVEYRVTAEEEVAVEERVADGEQMAASDEHPAEAERSAQAAHISYLPQEHTEEVWDLYLVEYPPAAGEARTFGDDELDWSLDWPLDVIESERSSAGVGPHPSD